MDPLTVVAEASTIVQLVWSILGQFQAIQPASKSAFANDSLNRDAEYARLQLIVSVQRLLRWKEIWTLDQDSLSESDKKHSIWGIEGWRDVHALLLQIDSECSQIRRSIDQWERSKTSESRRNAAQRKNFARPWLPAKKKTKKFECATWQKSIDELSKHVDELWSVSEVYFRAVHRYHEPSLRNVPPGKFLDTILETRAEARAFYDHCSDEYDRWLDIDLATRKGHLASLGGKDGDICHRKSYHIFRKVGGTWPDIEVTESIVRPVDSKETTSDAQKDSMEIVQDLKSFEQRTGNGRVAMFKCKGTNGDSHFCFRVEQLCRRMTLDGANRPTAFIQIDGDPRTATLATNRVLLAEKFRLSYKIATFGLFFVDTPWMEHLGNDNLRRVISPEDNTPHYLLNISRGSIQRSDVSCRPAARQIFSIGVLLLQLALERASDLKDSKMLSNDLLQVQRTMGQQYREACEFCLTLDLQTASGNATTEAKVSETEGSTQKQQVANPSGEQHLTQPNVNDSGVTNEIDLTSINKEPWTIVPRDADSVDIESRQLLKQYYNEVFLRLEHVYNAVRPRTEDTPISDVKTCSKSP